jgi:hypothetical protein
MTARCLGEKESVRVVPGVRGGGEMEMRMVILLSDEEMGRVPFWGMFIILTIMRRQVLHTCILAFWGIGIGEQGVSPYMYICRYSGIFRTTRMYLFVRSQRDRDHLPRDYIMHRSTCNFPSPLV